MVFTPYPYDHQTAQAFRNLSHLDDGRIRFDRVEGDYGDDWKMVGVWSGDQATLVYCRRADCGASCRCAAEIRLLES